MSPLKSQVMAGDGHMKVQGIIVGVASIVLGVNATTQELAIEEIVVTATKRAESVQDIPLAVTAFTGAQLEEAGVKDIRDIAGQTPGLSITARGETEGNVFIRGIGSVAPGIGLNKVPARTLTASSIPFGTARIRSSARWEGSSARWIRMKAFGIYTAAPRSPLARRTAA
jgi:hypothetical protein